MRIFPIVVSVVVLSINSWQSFGYEDFTHSTILYPAYPLGRSHELILAACRDLSTMGMSNRKNFTSRGAGTMTARTARQYSTAERKRSGLAMFFVR